MTTCTTPSDERRSDIATERQTTVKSTCPLFGSHSKPLRSPQRAARNEARTFVGVARESTTEGVLAVAREAVRTAAHTTIPVVDTTATFVFLSNKPILSLPNDLDDIFGNFLILFKR